MRKNFMGGYRFFRFFDDNLSNHPCTIKNVCPLTVSRSFLDMDGHGRTSKKMEEHEQTLNEHGRTNMDKPYLRGDEHGRTSLNIVRLFDHYAGLVDFWGMDLLWVIGLFLGVE